MRRQQLTYIFPLDGWRAVAIVLVLLHHFFGILIPASNATGIGHWVKFVLNFAWSGVDLFFLLSGFLIGRILIVHKSSEHFFSTFYLRRAFRIIPAYMVMLLAFWIVVRMGGYLQSPWLFQGAFPGYSYGLFIQNFWMAAQGHFGAHWLGPTWSLAIEEQFYLLLPLLVWWLPTRKLPWLLMMGIVLAPVFRFYWGDVSAYVLLPARMDALFMGVLLAWLYLKGAIAPQKNNSRLVLVAAVLLLLLMYTFIALSGAGYGNAFLHSMLTIFYGCLLLATLSNTHRTWVNAWLANKAVRFVARISYSLYLWHQPANGMVHAWFKKSEPQMQTVLDVWIALSGILLSFILAIASYYWLERPLLRYAQRFEYK